MYIPESKKRPGQFPPWADLLINQLLLFPTGEHDDLVDTMSQALIYLRDARMLTIDDGKYKDEYVRPVERSNPYAA